MINGSILSFPDRGPWGDARYPGNCSGYVYKALFELLRPRTFVDPMVGSGTSVQVAKEMGIEAHGFDLRDGFDVVHDSLVERLGKQADLVLSHPPYHDMYVYSGVVWGADALANDLSRCRNEDEFIRRLLGALRNQRNATVVSGHYGVIIGDLRRNGKYHSFQAGVIAGMAAFQELRAVLIKAQHNTRSGNKEYRGLTLPRIMHEYVLLWQKSDQ